MNPEDKKRLNNKWHSSKIAEICWMKILFGRIPTKPKYICYHKHEKSSTHVWFRLECIQCKKLKGKKICLKLDPFRFAVILDKFRHYLMNELFGCSWIDWKFMDVSIEKRPQYITFLKSQYITFKVSWSDWKKNEPVCLMKSRSSFCSFNDLRILNNKTICSCYSCVSGRWQLIWIYFLSLSVIFGFRRNTIDGFRRNTWNSQRNFASRFMVSIWNGAKLWLINVTGFKWKVSTEWLC